MSGAQHEFHFAAYILGATGFLSVQIAVSHQNDAVSISLYDTMQHVLIFSDEGQYDAPRLQGQGGGTQY